MNFRIKSHRLDNHAIQQSNTDAKIIDEDDDFDLENWSIDDYRLFTNWDIVEHNDWNLPGTKEERSYCASWKTRGCTHIENHNHPDYQGKAYVKHYKWYCKRRCCKICFEKWIAREANAATKRIEEFARKTGRTPIHMVLSISNWDSEKDFKEMKKKARKILDQIGIVGGDLIFHPFRFNKKLRCWYYSPHFHCVCFGNIPTGKITTSYYENGWIIKYLGPRKSVFSTMYYLLAHCGVKKGVSSVTWFGELSYGKVKKEKEPNRNVCPLCGRKLVDLHYEGIDPPFIIGQEFEGYVSTEGWHEVKKSTETEETGFEYSPIFSTNEILRSLSQSNY